MGSSQTVKVYKRDKGICHYCLTQTKVKNNHNGCQPPNTATKEHVVPRALGGPNVMSNYVLACHKCNNRRGITLFFCRCSGCHSKIEEFLGEQENIDKIFWALVGYNKPSIVRDRDGMWRVRQPGVNVRFALWQHAVDYVSIQLAAYKEA